MADEKGYLVHRGGTAGTLVQSEREMAVARWVLQHARPAGYGTDTLPGAEGIFLPLVGRKGPMGVLGVALRNRPQQLAPSQRQLLDVFVNQIALALERAIMTGEAEKAQVSAETERLRSALLSSVSHDFRTPLAAVTGAATSLLQGGDKLGPEARTELLETIREESERLGRLVTDLLDITRIESGSVKIKKEWCPLEEVIGSTLARLEGKLVGRDVKVDLPWPMLQAPLDAVLAEQLLFNLLENAIKYTPSGSPIEVHAREDGKDVIVEIRDRGPGIAPGEEGRIFERFYRSAEGGTVGGTGLGLAVCQAVVKAHGGRITAQSREGGGTVFRFTLPLEGTPPAVQDGSLG
jgi:two-component system sensor histidine kinase KdpD